MSEKTSCYEKCLLIDLYQFDILNKFLYRFLFALLILVAILKICKLDSEDTILLACQHWFWDSANLRDTILY